MAQVLIRISPKGDVSIKAEGVQGPSCALHTKAFRDALGREIAHRPTEEFYAQATQHTTVQQNQ